MADQPAPDPAAEPTFEQTLDELESIVKLLESGSLPLEKSIEIFERGMALSQKCSRQLEAAETRIEMISRRDGKAEPFAPSHS